jgi:hypothetical protein
MRNSLLIGFLILVCLVLSCVKEWFIPTEDQADTRDVGQSSRTVATAENQETVCPCFTPESLNSLLDVVRSSGWWSDVPGCRTAPYDQLLELWISRTGLSGDMCDYSIRAGTINRSSFASSAIFNHNTGQFDVMCGGYTTPDIAESCTRILSQFIQGLRRTHSDWNYCERIE